MKAICFRITLALTLTLFTMTELVAARPLPAQGTLLWQQTLIGTANGFGQAFSVAVDNQGNVVTAGGTNIGFTVAKFDRDGTLLWLRNLSGTASGFNEAFSVTVDNQGNVVAAGVTQNVGTYLDFTVTKFDRDGTLLWQQNLGNFGLDEAFSVAVDNRGDVVAVGTSDRTVAKFARDGTLLWQQNLNGTAANSSDQALSVAVDNQGNVLAAGFTQNTAGTSYFTVAKFAR